MTWPFENDTSAVVKKYAKRSMRKSRIKTLLSVLTIMLSVALLSGFILSVVGMATETKRELQTANHAIYYNINDKQIEELRQDNRIADSRIYIQAGNTQVDDYLIIPVYIEQKDSNIAVEELVEGQYPIGLYDAAVDKAYLSRLGLPTELGTKITIPFYDGSSETFTVVGLTDNGSTERVYSLYCSEKYAHTGGQFETSVTALTVQLADATQMSSENFKETVQKIGTDYGITAQYSDYNDGFVASLEPNQEDIMIISIFSIAVLFVSYLVIYSIFYIYVQNQIREFGQLRTMGATPKQIKTILRTQGKILCILGTILGLIIGGTAAFLFKPDGWSWLNTALVSVLIFGLVYAMVWLALSKPAKIAGSVSPIEAAKSTGYQSAQLYSKKLHRRITPFSMAVMGSSRNRRKWVVTVLSLGVAGIMFMGGTTLLSSLDMERFARQGLLEYGEFEIDLSRNAVRNDPHGATGVQLNNPLNDELIQNITQIEGVKEVTQYKTLEAKFEYNHASRKDKLVSFTSEQQKILKQYLSAGTIDYQSMVENKEILVLRNEYADYVFDWTFQVGDTVKFRWFDGQSYQETEYTIAGEISDEIFKDPLGGKLFGKAGFFLLPDQLLQKMVVPDFNFNSHLLISINDFSLEPEVREKMNSLMETIPTITMETLHNLYQDSEAMYQRTSLVIWGLSSFIMLFAVINLINTLIATTLSRKHEFSTLRSIGMGKKQLQWTIQWEGILLAFWNIGITLVAGTAVGYGIVHYLNSVGDDSWVWQFPLVYFVGYAIISIILPMIISAVIIHILQKKSIVEQLRESD
ncbi:MAG: ABC transporter permease [Eisenbergiella sp.]